MEGWWGNESEHVSPMSSTPPLTSSPAVSREEVLMGEKRRRVNDWTTVKTMTIRCEEKGEGGRSRRIQGRGFCSKRLSVMIMMMLLLWLDG